MRARRKERLSLHRGVVPPASGRDQAWSMDFVHDQLVTGRTFRVLTVIDQWSRDGLHLGGHDYSSKINQPLSSSSFECRRFGGDVTQVIRIGLNTIRPSNVRW